MLGDFSGGENFQGPGHGRVDGLCAAEAQLLWAIRRLALMRPIGAARCHAVHIALQQDFGDAGLGIEHLLRCWLVGLSRLATRRLAFGAPACPLLLPDEAALLRVLRAANHDDVARTALVALAGAPAAADLLPLFVAVRALIPMRLPQIRDCVRADRIRSKIR